MKLMCDCTDCCIIIRLTTKPFAETFRKCTCLSMLTVRVRVRACVRAYVCVGGCGMTTAAAGV